MDVPLASRQFTDSVDDLIAGAWTGMLYSGSVYERLRENMTASTASYGGGSKSRPPCRIDVLNLLAAIDATVAEWWTDAATTVDRLTKMAQHGWAPADVGTLCDRTAQIGKWVAEGRELLGDNPIHVTLRRPCPRCNALWSYRTRDKEQVRAYALTVGELGAACGSCGAQWKPDQYGLLAQLLEA